MLKILLTLLHVIVSVVLILVVLLQTGKRADLAGAFGGGGSQTAFGARGAATLLSKATTARAGATEVESGPATETDPRPTSINTPTSDWRPGRRSALRFLRCS